MCLMVKAGRKRSTNKAELGWADLAAQVLREAKLGDTRNLADYLRAGYPVTPEHREFLAELLKRSDGKRGRAALRRQEKRLIALQVEGLIEEDLKTDAAVAEVMKLRGVSRATVYAALRESKRRK
jgi:hypothetical protein